MAAASSSPNRQSPNGHPAANHGPSVEDLLYEDDTPRRSSQLHDLLQTLWEGKWIILGVVVLTVAATAIYTYTLPTNYRTSSLLLVDRDGQTSVLSGFGRGRRSPFAEQDQTLQNELLVLRQSRTIANRVAKRLLAMDTHPETGAPLQVVRGVEGNRLSQAQVARRVKGRTSAQPSGEETDALYVSATSGNPHEAALLANLYAEEYIQRTKEKSRSDLKASREFLEEQADTLRAEVQGAERKLQEYMSQEQAVSLDQETGRVVQRISDLESKRAELRIERDMKRASMETLKEEIEKIEPKLAERLSSSLEERLSQAQEEKAELEAKIDRIERENPDLQPGSRQYRDLQRMKDRTATLTRRTDSLAVRYVNEALSAGGVAAGSAEDGGGKGVSYVAEKRRELAQHRIELNGLQARLDVINERLQENRQSLQEIPSKSIRMAQLQRERRSSEQVYSFVQEKLQEARLQEQSEMGYAEVIRSAGPGRPVGPDTRKNLLLGFMLGLVAGGGIVVLREKLDTRIHQPAGLRDHGHRVLGVVPSMTPIIEDDFGGRDTIEVDGRSVRTSLAMMVSPMSAAAEAYRRIRTNLQFARPDDGVQTFAVSSADKGAGKTTTCANLALALASAGKRTVVVDADLRRPWCHELFGRAREPGLSTALYDEDGPLDAFSSGVDGLSVIPAGEEVPNPAELLGSQRMERLLGRLEEAFDYVIVDTPPALLFSDMLGLVPHCDGALLVARAGETDGHAFDHTVDRVTDVNGNLLGCVLNEFDASSILYSDGSDYGYAYAHRRLQDYYEDDDQATVQQGLRRWWSG
jgi:capsular exopolysaccharide synthesis family protein